MYVASVSMLVKVSVCSSPTTPKPLAFNSGLLPAVQAHKRIRQGFISPGRSSRESCCAGPVVFARSSLATFYHRPTLAKVYWQSGPSKVEDTASDLAEYRPTGSSRDKAH